jgi:hypothetical protein
LDVTSNLLATFVSEVLVVEDDGLGGLELGESGLQFGGRGLRTDERVRVLRHLYNCKFKYLGIRLE